MVSFESKIFKMPPRQTFFRPDTVTAMAGRLCGSGLTILLSATSLSSEDLPQNGQITSGDGIIAQRSR